jgi:hypothetical protein
MQLSERDDARAKGAAASLDPQPASPSSNTAALKD